MIVEEDMRFERCYRIDEDSTTPIPDKRRCWYDWRIHYSKEQDGIRIQYANDRIRVLDEAGSAPIVGAVVAAGPSASANAVACPAPSSPYAPPPSIKTQEAIANEPSTPRAQNCLDGCTQTWHDCVPPCKGASACRQTCDTEFRACARKCL